MAVIKKYKVLFNPIGKSVDVLSGTSILEAARIAGINLTAVCGGKGICGQCRVIISDGEVSSPKPNEEDLLSRDDISNGYRLACSTFPKSDIKVHVPEKSLLTDIRLQIDGERVDVQVNPIIQSFDIALDKPSLENPVADLNAVMGVLKDSCNTEKLSADIMAIKQLSPLLRESNWEISVFIRHDEIIGFCRKGALPVGLALDMGTTKIAAYLIDLTTGEELASSGAINPQTIYGDDVMSRLDTAIHGDNLTESGITQLAKVIRDLLNEMIGDLTAEAGLKRYHVADICIVGNTAMTHLFLDLPVKQLASSPYIAASNTAIDVKARDLDLSACPGAYVHILPGIGGFVGADHVSMVLASDIDLKDRITLGVDIGTNTEIVLSNPADNSLVSLSCPSGPAFEGAHVTDGMRAANGAIESVKLTEEGVEYKTIGNDPAIGLCGSGIIDVIAELHRWNIINDRGRFDRDNKRVSQGKYGSEFSLTNNNENNIVVSQKDIAEIQLAKGAINAGIEALMEVCNIKEDMIEEVIIAGAFGTYIDLVNTIDIGLLPSFPNARYMQVGNSAGVGAKMALVSQSMRQRAQSIAAKTRYLELTTHPSFSRRFAQGMRFPLEKQVIGNNK